MTCTMRPGLGRWLLASAMLIAAGLAGGCQTPNPLLRQQGMNALERGEVDRADNRFAKAIDQDPTDWKAQYYLGKVRLAQNRPLEAQLALEKALSMRIDHGDETADILDALAEAVHRQDRPAELAAMLDRACQDYGTMRDYLRQAEYLGKAGDVDGAKVGFRRAILADRHSPLPYIKQADFLESVGDRDGAIKSLRHAYYLEPSPRLGERFRKYGIVPGPTVGLPPEEPAP